jgi:multisubunit Na+/H+ antiporter MnhF subunit
MSDARPAVAPHDLPYFITGPGETDWMMVNTAIFLVVVVLGVGVLFLRLHSLPERLAHNSQKLQMEIVAVLCLLALFSHNHAFWVAALLLALIDLPDIGTPVRRMADALDRMAGPRKPAPPARDDAEARGDA